MRTIKFRAWDGQKMIDNWLVMKQEHTQTVVTQRSVAGLVPMQFTGLLDKNGKEIYESDILETGTGHHLTVEWNEACGMWTLDGL